jgi:hypothetical protein
MDQQPLIAECRLDLESARRQRDRYRTLGGQASGIRRGSKSVIIKFDPELDQTLLEETIAVEKDCCPFFEFDYSQEELTLTIGVGRDEQRPALDALAFALGSDEDSGVRTARGAG